MARRERSRGLGVAWSPVRHTTSPIHAGVISGLASSAWRNRLTFAEQNRLDARAHAVRVCCRSDCPPPACLVNPPSQVDYLPLKEGLGLGDALRADDATRAFGIPAISSERDVLVRRGTRAACARLDALSRTAYRGRSTRTADGIGVCAHRRRRRAHARRGVRPGEAPPRPRVRRAGLRSEGRPNTVAPDGLKSVDAKTIEETTLHTRRDVSRDSAFAAFGLDPSRDLLRAVTGTPQDGTLAHRLTGADSLGIWTLHRCRTPRHW